MSPPPLPLLLPLPLSIPPSLPSTYALTRYLLPSIEYHKPIWTEAQLPGSINMLTTNNISVQPSLLLRALPWDYLTTSTFHSAPGGEVVSEDIKRIFGDVRMRSTITVDGDAPCFLSPPSTQLPYYFSLIQTILAQTLAGFRTSCQSTTGDRHL